MRYCFFCRTNFGKESSEAWIVSKDTKSLNMWNKALVFLSHMSQAAGTKLSCLNKLNKQTF